MHTHTSNTRMLTRLCFRLLPVQILLAAVGSVNGIVTSLFATNSIGTDAMTAVGLYAPASMLVGAFSTMLVGGSQILCAEFKGREQVERSQEIFSLDILLACAFSAVCTLVLFLAGALHLTGLFTQDAQVCAYFDQYLIGMALGVLPQVLGQQLSAFLSLENRSGRAFAASIAYILINPVLDYLFVYRMHLEALGLALASSIGLWVFCIVQIFCFLRPDAVLKLQLRSLSFRDAAEILRIGSHGALTNGYLTFRSLWVNGLILAYVGNAGLSAFTACNSFLNLFWAVPAGMLAVSRMLISVSVGEEDRQSLLDVMRVMLWRFLPLVCAMAVALILCAVPLTRLYYQDPSAPVYMMAVWGFRILPLCMPFSLICMHFTCYGQVCGREALVHITALLDGVLCVGIYATLLIPLLGMNSVYIANVLNGLTVTFCFFLYAVRRNRHVPRDLAEWMVVPADFGVGEDARMDLSVRSVEEVTAISEEVQAFCLQRGIDPRRAMLSALALEEMAGNVIDHGFRKDRKPHSVDIRVVDKDGALILRIKDDCVPFDPASRRDIAGPSDPSRNIGIRMVYRIARSVSYQNILGLNVLTIRI